MVSHFKSLFLLISLFSACTVLVAAQDAKPAETPKQSEKPAEKPKKEEKKDTKPQKADPNNPTAEQVAESVVFIYGGLGGRESLKQIRKTTIESGKVNLVNADGTSDNINYERRIMRGENLEKERVRLDQEFPDAKYALIYSDNKVIGLYNESSFTPRDDATRAFQNQIWHGLEAVLRYKENGSTLNLAGRETKMGVDFYVLEVTDKEKRKTKFYVSAKTFRVMWLEYQQDGVNFMRKFYDYRYAQGTLVPYRTILLSDGKQIEETMVSSSTFGQKLDEEIFKAN